MRSAAARRTKADAVRRARSLRSELSFLIDELSKPGPPDDAAERCANTIFERSRALEYVVRDLVRKGRNNGA